MKFSNYNTERLLLRKPEFTDIDELFLLRTSESVMQFLERPATLSKDDVLRFIHKIHNGIEQDGWMYWAIALKGDDTLIGTICFWNIDDENAEAEIGFELLPEWQGKGIMHEAIQAVIQFGFENMQLKIIKAYTAAGNTKSRVLLEKNNFKLQTVLEKNENAKFQYAVYCLMRDE